MTTEDEESSAKLRETSARLFDLATSAMLAGTVSLGLKLNLYEALAKSGPVTSDDLAKRTGYQERWLREWLRCQAAGEVLQYLGDGRFALPAEAAELLVEKDRVDSMRHPFDYLFYRFRMLERLPESFRTGLGLTWDEQGIEAVQMAEQAVRNTWYRREFVKKALPLLSGVAERLEAGAKVADVGCGAATALVALAETFPRSQFSRL